MADTVWTPTDEALQWAHAYLEPVQGAANRLSQHENKGAARIGRRITRYVDFCQARLALLLDGLNNKQRAIVGVLPALLHFNHEELPGFANTRFPVFGVQGFQLSEMVERCGRIALSKELSAFDATVERPVFQSVFVSVFLA